jgi:hypothetical protein
MANIGDQVSGGTVFYTGTTILIAATRDLIGSRYWGCYLIGIDGTFTDIGTGQANTGLIVSGCTGNTMIAATSCDNLVLNGYSDWFLPSKDELNEMYKLKDLILGDFDLYDNYWSSSQYNPEAAWIQYFLNGTQSRGDKDQLYRVRPIRAV